MKQIKSIIKDTKYQAFGVSLLALLFFILACTLENTAAAITFGILAGVAFIGGCILLYFVHRTASATNYFLYDSRRNVHVSLDRLTFEFVDDKIVQYVSPYIEHTRELWQGMPKNLEIAMQANDAYRMPVALKMLHDVSLMPIDEIVPFFKSVDKRTVAAVCRALKRGQDQEMADVLFELKCDSERLEGRIAPFFSKNRRCFENRMVYYIKKHIREFDVGKK